MKKRISILSILLLLGMTVYAQTDIPKTEKSFYLSVSEKIAFIIGRRKL